MALYRLGVGSQNLGEPLHELGRESRVPAVSPSKKSKMRIENMLKAALSRNAGGEGAMPEAQSGISRRIRI
ncbi:hypothetical protein BST63_02535 [Bradyrhizobium canariense]|uniref:Uncharacterized protein n=1 Tax=Bradyrhizobium canariense TaxID=255045 RepID=A0ABX3XAI2_9BRAD|nr:hypothetical protein BSR47_02690 [Bradyrhizobium canariense]OSJ35115.1 hypothetical protein BST63_02535 [Bradyrhizobium canariense]